MRLIYTNMYVQSKPSSELPKTPTSEVGLPQNLRAYKTWICCRPILSDQPIWIGAFTYFS